MDEPPCVSIVQRVVLQKDALGRNALDRVFVEMSSDGGHSLNEHETEMFLVRVNGELGRGGTARHIAAVFNKQREEGKPLALTRQEWYGVFAR